jgi:hypothetical protein
VIRNRGATLIEMLLVMAMTAIVVGSMASLYGFVAIRTAHTIATTSALDQAEMVADEITYYVMNSKETIRIVSGSQYALKCRMPVDFIDIRNSGRPDRYILSSVSAIHTETFDDGVWVWFYTSDSSGDYGKVGNNFYKAIRSDNANPVGANVDAAWNYHHDGSHRFNLVDGFFATSNSGESMFTVTASADTRANIKSASGSTATDNRAVAVSRHVAWRCWR